ncbi:MAG: type II toxin-antitoxin system HipA family toxin [Candidatus Dormibacteria bacterium]
MRSGTLDHVTVELDAAELSGPVDIGVLRRTKAAGGSIVGFAYSDEWLARKDPFPIDPLHGLYPGDQWPRDGKIDRIFTDAAPDRWGRTLLSRQEAHAATTEKRRRRMLDEWDYLLGISDVSRMGALRLRAPDGRYVDDADEVPPMTRLPDLVTAVREIESPSRDHRRQALSLALLLAPGSSLGGARPKASFLAQDGSLWMAKFPSRTDTRDMAACEWVLNELAAGAGIEVPEHRLLEVGTGQHSFLARRFDRAGGSRRLYASAMTLLSRRDREDASYLDIALAIADHGERSAIGAELAAMFRRVVFNVLTAHRDDHLRNHGFLRRGAGWLLAPAFDLNPMPDMPEHTLAIDAVDHIGDIDLVLSTAEFYRLSSAQAGAIVDEVRAALVGWERTAQSAKLGPDEMDTIAEALGD